MKTYLVGGAVRDQLLGRPVVERDHVVTGATPADMLARGFVPVGADFPVFLHPITKEEHALARTERKSGQGHGGFTFYTDPSLTVEDDLIRRDLTINAMAIDPVSGAIIDPCGGQRDLAARVLRHVSPAFVEDPLRVLRVARFAARYAPLGFAVAPETLALMQDMVQRGELAHLSAERVWKEIERALMEPACRVFIEVLRACGALAALLPELAALFGVPQRRSHHPEIDTGIHTLMALEQAVREQAPLAVRWAVLLHDLGKGTTDAEHWPRHPQHESRGVPLVEAVSRRLRVPVACRELAVLVCREHLLCHQSLQLRAGTVWRLLQRLDGLRRPERLEAFLQACRCDARGRLGFENRPYPQADWLQQCLQEVRGIRRQQLPADVPDVHIGEALVAARIAAIDALMAARHAAVVAAPHAVTD